MKERPILFSTEMVRAILEGRKTQTRRIIKPQPPRWRWEIYKWDDRCVDIGNTAASPYYVIPKHGAPGDHLWVRETWATHPHNDDKKPSDLPKNGTHVFYKETGNNADHIKWRPSIFMPRWASRITLEIENVRVERVQEITHEDAVAEGCYEKDGKARGRLGFSHLWDSINNAEGKRWKDNPWVWVVEFRKVRNP